MPPRWRICIFDTCTSPALPTCSRSDLMSLAMKTLKAEGVEDGELTLSFVDAPEMEDLHIRYMHEPGPTDVLSFRSDVVGNEDVEGGGRRRRRADAVVRGCPRDGGFAYSIHARARPYRRALVQI